MVRALLIAVAAASILGSTLVDTEALLDRPSDHHKHGRLLDAAAGEGTHEHGDSDDHHPTPDSPCEHHVQHCCCGHVPAVAAFGSVASGGAQTSQRLSLPPSSRSGYLFAEPLFHVPLA